MGWGSSSLCLKILFILLIVALIVQILATALPYWVDKDQTSYDYNSGLFRSCTEIGQTKSCSNIKNPADWLVATQFFEVTAILLIVAALVLCIIVLFAKDMKVLKLICWILCFCAFAFILIGAIIYAVEISDIIDDALSGAFAIAIIASVLCLVAGILGALDWAGKAK